MDSFAAMALGQSALMRGAPHKVFDWEKAAQLIKDRKPTLVRAGLGSDWEYTGGDIYSNGEPVMDGGTYLSSNWATPEIELDGDVVPCWRMMAETEWDEETVWPASALAILKS